MFSDEKYSSESIICDERATVSKNALHYLVVLDKVIPGKLVLAPTQGQLKFLGEDGEGSEKKTVWAYLRYHRRPFFLYVNSDGSFVNTIHLPFLSLYGTMAHNLAKKLIVFDRRHDREDPDYETPGEPSDALVVAN